MLLDILKYFHLVETVYAKGSTEFSITDIPFSQIFINFVNFLWTWPVTLFILYLWFKAGMLYVTAEGASEKLKKAHESIRRSAVWTALAAILYGLLLAATDGLKGSL